ncbi:hypothetical protein FOZ63_029729 [Perkinsus olseni]|uniref:Uncharacterized protein n=1 Tax=Perkinsus olseni TaxID=32597 RepID=A0A7J6RA02_PEROL|nr:hypothetical protein FOZ63_029729 [Perkinsus olseni]
MTLRLIAGSNDYPDETCVSSLDLTVHPTEREPQTLAKSHLHVFFFERNSSWTVCFNGPSYLVRVAVSLEDLSRLFVHRSQKVS